MKIESTEFILSAHHEEQFRCDGRPEIAFVGRSNVGKSSLMNRLLRRKGLAKTSSTPGRTQAVNYFLINDRFYFVDLPGYGFAKASRSSRQQWAQLMNRYFRSAAERRVFLIQLVDGKVGATVLDEQALEYFESLSLEPCIVATKIDKVPRTKQTRGIKAIRQSLQLTEDEQVLPVSAASGQGIPQIWKEISAFLYGDAEKPQQVQQAGTT